MAQPPKHDIPLANKALHAPCQAMLSSHNLPPSAGCHHLVVRGDRRGKRASTHQLLPLGNGGHSSVPGLVRVGNAEGVTDPSQALIHKPGEEGLPADFERELATLVVADQFAFQQEVPQAVVNAPQRACGLVLTCHERNRASPPAPQAQVVGDPRRGDAQVRQRGRGWRERNRQVGVDEAMWGAQ